MGISVSRQRMTKWFLEDQTDHNRAALTDETGPCCRKPLPSSASAVYGVSVGWGSNFPSKIVDALFVGLWKEDHLQNESLVQVEKAIVIQIPETCPEVFVAFEKFFQEYRAGVTDIVYCYPMIGETQRYHQDWDSHRPIVARNPSP